MGDMENSIFVKSVALFIQVNRYGVYVFVPPL